MRKILKRFLPCHETVQQSRWLRPFSRTLLHPRLWHLNRHSAAGAIAVGLFCGLIPGPFQMLGAAIGCVALRVNLPLALLTTLYSNPITIVPLYIAAYAIGARITGDHGNFVKPPELADLQIGAWMNAIGEWMLDLGQPLALGLLVMAAAFSLLGYIGVKTAWRLWLIHAWRKRNERRSAPLTT